MLPPILAKAAAPRKSSRQAGTLICKVVNKTAAVDTFNKMLVIKLCGGSVMVGPGSGSKDVPGERTEPSGRRVKGNIELVF